MNARNSIYRSAGVNYELLDEGKRRAIAAASATSHIARARGAKVMEGSRGEPAFVLNIGGLQLAMVMECLGTKSTLAREHQEATGVDRYEWTGYDGVAAIVNDLCGAGALPLMINAYFATGSAEWYEIPGRFNSLVLGWQRACEDSGAVWGGGESPMLSGLICEQEIDLAGCAVGLIPNERRPLFGDLIEAGDEIVLIESSGLHTNGSSLARMTGKRAGLDSKLSDGRSLGDAMLAPSAIYATLLEAIYAEDIPLSYGCPITGHGLRKLMRANRRLTYRIVELLPVLEVFNVIVDTLQLSPADAYGTLNMGVGFAFMCPSGNGERIVKKAFDLGLRACIGGVVEEGNRQVILEPIEVVFDDDELRLR